MKPESGAVEIVKGGCGIQTLQNDGKPTRLIGSDFPAVIFLEQGLQTLVPEVLDHLQKIVN